MGCAQTKWGPGVRSRAYSRAEGGVTPSEVPRSPSTRSSRYPVFIKEETLVTEDFRCNIIRLDFIDIYNIITACPNYQR